MQKLCIVYFLLACAAGWANTLNLVNDSPYLLRSVIYDATGAMLSEITLASGDTIQWSDNVGEFDTETESPASQTPYVVNWYCMSGNSFGSCNSIPPGATVNAQGCIGAQECQGNQN